MRAPIESPISMRSCLSVERETFQPSPRRPTMFCAGMRAPSKNTSQKSTPPCIITSGRTSMPGVFIGINRYEMPACLGASGSVRNRPNIMAASAALLVQIF